jgi:prevent-host-death family protein
MDDSWTVAEAKAKLSEVIDRAQSDGPQLITRNGKKAVIVVDAEEWDRKTRRKGSLSEFLASSPLGDAELDLERIKDGAREIDL